MSGPDVLDRLDGLEALRRERWEHMLLTIRARFHELHRDEAHLWRPYFEELSEVVEREDFEAAVRLVKAGYQRVLFERNVRKRGAEPIPQTKEEWNRLPDVLPEFKRRYGIA